MLCVWLQKNSYNSEALIFFINFYHQRYSSHTPPKSPEQTNTIISTFPQQKPLCPPKPLPHLHVVSQVHIISKHPPNKKLKVLPRNLIKMQHLISVRKSLQNTISAHREENNGGGYQMLLDTMGKSDGNKWRASSGVQVKREAKTAAYLEIVQAEKEGCGRLKIFVNGGAEMWSIWRKNYGLGMNSQCGNMEILKQIIFFFKYQLNFSHSNTFIYFHGNTTVQTCLLTPHSQLLLIECPL